MKKIFYFFVLYFLIFTLKAQSLSLNEGKLSAEDLVLEALKASGTSEDKIPDYLLKLESLSETYLADLKRENLFGEEAAEYALTFLYADTLSAYQMNQTCLDVLLDSKIYNCVSSTVITLYLLKKAGIECYGIEAPGHSFVEVDIDGKTVRVETTNPFGYNPGTKKTVENSNSRYYVKAINYRNAKRVSDRRIAALIYNNRVATLTNSRKSQEALPLAVEAYNLQLQSDESLSYLRSIGSNAISEYVDRRKFFEGLDYAREFKASWGFSKDCITNTESLVSWIVRDYTKAKEYDECLSFLDSVTDLLPESNLQKYRTTTVKNACVGVHNKVAPLFNSGRYEEALELVTSGIEKYGEDKTLLKDLNLIKSVMETEE